MFTSLPNDHPLNKLKTCILHLALLVQSRDDSKATNICDALHKVEEEAKEIIHKRETELACGKPLITKLYLNHVTFHSIKQVV